MVDFQLLRKCWMDRDDGHGLLRWQLSGMYMCIGKTNDIDALLGSSDGVRQSRRRILNGEGFLRLTL